MQGIYAYFSKVIYVLYKYKGLDKEKRQLNCGFNMKLLVDFWDLFMGYYSNRLERHLLMI